MTLRTPRRRISPRTKHRYRVIRNFFRRALGSSSQPSIKISSSIAINVTDLKHRLGGIQNQLNEATRHCQDISYLENISKPSSNVTELKQVPSSSKHQIEQSVEGQYNESEAKVLYKTSENNFPSSDPTDQTPKSQDHDDNNRCTEVSRVGSKTSRTKKKKNKLKYTVVPDESVLRSRKTKSALENVVAINSTDSYESTAGHRMAQRAHAGDCNRQYHRANIDHAYKGRSESLHERKEKGHHRQKIMNNNRDLDNEFIADIIRRQYKPVKLFGRKESDFSQLSAPVCRDQEYSYNNYFGDCSELCSCCYDSNRSKYKRHIDLSDMRSICDTRLYSSNKAKIKTRRRYMEAQNDSELYDLIPVKEKSSPKSRRKFAEDNIRYHYYKEVPPSPRTHRPQLNLKAQHYEDYFYHHQRKSRSPNRHERNVKEIFESDLSSETPQAIESGRRQMKTTNMANAPEHSRNESGTLNSRPNTYIEDQTCHETHLNKTQDTDMSTDKTDRALCEIKDILQSFLQEIKKEATVSQCEKSDVTSKAAGNVPNNIQLNSTNASMLPNSGPSFNYSNQANIPPYIPAFTNPCCYPILPVCPMNCIQNGYVVPSPSYTCANCTKDEKPKISNSKVCSSETEELIKEIYKHVLETPGSRKKETSRDENKRILTSRSVGGSMRTSKRNVKIGTPKLKCYSKSCEAITPRMAGNYYDGTYASYSDTLLERLSIEPTPSETVSETDFTMESMSTEKGKSNKFAKVLRSFGLFRKKKDVIEELSESESTVEVDVKPKSPPFRQNITNYAMYEQEYYHRPPIPPHPYHEYPEYRPPFQQNLPPTQDPYHPHSYSHMPYDPTYPPHPQYPRPGMPMPRSRSFDHHVPNVPLCLKEIEVKSTATQSERKMSFFERMKTKMQMEQARRDDYQRNCSTQTQQNSTENQTKPGLFNWKNVQPKPLNKDPLAFSYLKQKQLAEGDVKMRNALLKKLFYKRNPFSPRNLIVRTLLGKDKSSYGEPPAIYRPKLFL